MRLLMVQLPTSHLGAGERVYPLGLSRLCGLVPDGTGFTSLDMNLSGDPFMELADKVRESSPDVTALSFRNLDPLAGHEASYLSSLVTAAKVVRKLAPDCRILAGGPAFSLFGRELMAAVPEIDMGLVGEGEHAFAGLLHDGVRPESIPGLLWRENGEIRHNPSKSSMDLADLPPMDLSAFAPSDYMDKNKYVAVMGVEGKRGCDLNCAYCVYPQIGGGRLRLRPPENIVDEIEWLHKETGAALFHFTDGVVNRPPDHFETVCRGLKARKLDILWTGFFRERPLTPENLALARESGLVAVYLSGDALTDSGLSLLNKRMTCEDLFHAARVTADNGILTVLHYLVNLPGQTGADRAAARDTLQKLLDIHDQAGNLGAVIFNHVRLYPGAPLTRRLLRKGMLPPETNLLYPTYWNPAEGAHEKHELDLLCHSAGVFSRLEGEGRVHP